MIFEFTQEDLLRGTVVKPSYYVVLIENETEAQSAKGDSTNCRLFGKILYDMDTRSEEFAGVPTPYWNFNSKALGMSKGFWQALGVDVAAGKRVDFSAVKGKKIGVFIGNKEFEGRMVNEIKDQYRTVEEQ